MVLIQHRTQEADGQKTVQIHNAAYSDGKNGADCEIEKTKKSKVNTGRLFVKWWREREKNSEKREMNMKCD